MESSDRAPQEVTGADRFAWRARLAACCAALVALAFAQSSGRIATDTKLDLVVAPWDFLGRALQMWDDQGAFGQLQNQGYGYLFPMGPFFGIFDSLGVPDWVTQRLWWSLILVVAFLGVVKLAGLLGIGSPWARVLAGFAFALSPRMLSVIGPSSIEVWPMAVAPWVVIPLVIGSQRGSPRRWAALSALAVGCVGGVNAAATFAVIPLAALWLLAADPGPRRRSLMLWWPPLVLAATLWWIIPLFLLGEYSPPFLDYIESINNTAFSSTVFDTLRGTSHWVPYIDSNAWAGRELLTDPLVIVNGVVVLCFGFLGLARADLPHRRFLVAGLVVGLLAVTSGHAGAVAGWFSDETRHLLDGVLAPLRNTHKFDVLLRLPLVLGLCHAVTVFSRQFEGQKTWDAVTARVGPAVLAVAALAGSTVPAWTGGIAPRDSFTDVPEYWAEAADWLGDFQNGRTLLTPATPFGDYVWGKTGDEPLQALATAPWAVRNVIPLAPGGNITALDAVSNQLATGRGSEALANYLARMGVGTVVVRHDIDRAQGVTSPELVRQTLVSTPGMQQVAAFGPNVGGGARLGSGDGAPFIAAGWQSVRPAIEVFALSRQIEPTHDQKWSQTPVLVGDSDSLMAADAWDLTQQTDVVMGPDVPKNLNPSTLILSDGNRRVEQSFGSVTRRQSATLTETEPFSQDRRVWRYDQDKLADWLTIPVLVGAESLTASSSRSDVAASPTMDQASSPFAAFDGDLATAWRPDQADIGEPSWLRLDFGRVQDLGDVQIRLDAPGTRSTLLEVTTEQGTEEVRVQGAGPATVRVGRVRSLTVTGTESFEQDLSITEITSPQLGLSRPLRLPEVPADWGAPDSIILQSAPEQSDGCETIVDVIRCSAAEEYLGEGGRTMDREIVLPQDASYAMSLRAMPFGGPELDDLLQTDQLVRVNASSQVTRSAEASAVRAIDGDPATGWVAGESDVGPSLTLRWLDEQPVSSLTLRNDDEFAASRPTQVRLIFSDGSSVERDVDGDVIEFPEVDTNAVTVQVVGSAPRTSLGFDGSITRLPVGIGELEVDGVDARFVPDPAPVKFACGSGPSVNIGGRQISTRVEASLAELASGSVVDLSLCGADSGDPIDLVAGSNRVIVGGSAAFRPHGVLFEADRPTTSPIGPTLQVRTQNQNAGWLASQAGIELPALVVNGWQQGWVERSPGAAIETTFVPQQSFQKGLGFGMVSLFLLLLAATAPAHRVIHERVARRPLRGLLRPLVPVAAVVVGGVVASWPGAIAGAAAVVAMWLTAGGRLATLRGWLVVVPVVAAGGFYLVGPWGSVAQWAGESAVPQLLGTFAVCALVAFDVRRPKFLSRSAGFSTNR